MSYDIKLVNEKGKVLQVDKHSEGGTYVMGGTKDAELNITYNYSKFFYKVFGKKGLSFLDGKKGKDCISVLERAVKTLGICKDDDYWKATAGNSGYALSILLKWAKKHKKGVFKVL